MRKTGIIRRVDDLGRVAIPKEIRQEFDIREGDPLELTLDGNKICFELYTYTEQIGEKIGRLIEIIEKDEHSISNKKTVISALEIAKELLRSEDNEKETV